MKYFLSLDQNGYLLSIYTADIITNSSDTRPPFINSIENIDISGNRVGAYYWNGKELIFDEDRYAEIMAESNRQEEKFRREERKDIARQEITDAVLTTTINSVEVDDNTALRWIDFYPEWSIGISYTIGFKVQQNSHLWRCLQAHTSQTGWEPPNVPALWEEINEAHSGTIDDPIPYNNNMTLENGKYYSQFDVTYHCIRDTGVPVYNNLADLVGLYVEIA